MWRLFITILNILCYVLYRSEKLKGLCNEKLKGIERLTPPSSLKAHWAMWDSKCVFGLGILPNLRVHVFLVGPDGTVYVPLNSLFS